jgi:hypothetical protein
VRSYVDWDKNGSGNVWDDEADAKVEDTVRSRPRYSKPKYGRIKPRWSGTQSPGNAHGSSAAHATAKPEPTPPSEPSEAETSQQSEDAAPKLDRDAYFATRFAILKPTRNNEDDMPLGFGLLPELPSDGESGPPATASEPVSKRVAKAKAIAAQHKNFLKVHGKTIAFLEESQDERRHQAGAGYRKSLQTLNDRLVAVMESLKPDMVESEYEELLSRVGLGESKPDHHIRNRSTDRPPRSWKPEGRCSRRTPADSQWAQTPLSGQRTQTRLDSKLCAGGP